MCLRVAGIALALAAIRDAWQEDAAVPMLEHLAGGFLLGACVGSFFGRGGLIVGLIIGVLIGLSQTIFCVMYLFRLIYYAWSGTSPGRSGRCAAAANADCKWTIAKCKLHIVPQARQMVRIRWVPTIFNLQLSICNFQWPAHRQKIVDALT
jgi:hypothetical protein